MNPNLELHIKTIYNALCGNVLCEVLKFLGIGEYCLQPIQAPAISQKAPSQRLLSLKPGEWSVCLDAEIAKEECIYSILALIWALRLANFCWWTRPARSAIRSTVNNPPVCPIQAGTNRIPPAGGRHIQTAPKLCCGSEKRSQHTGNIAFAGFTAPEILWIRQTSRKSIRASPKSCCL